MCATQEKNRAPDAPPAPAGPAQRGTLYPYPPARKTFGNGYLRIFGNHQLGMVQHRTRQGNTRATRNSGRDYCKAFVDNTLYTLQYDFGP
jgi:hypothetical protein